MKIDNYNDNTLLSGSYGADDIWINVKDYVTVDASDGDDTIRAWTDYSTLNAGAGNDTIHLMGQQTTIKAGTGNDSINLYVSDYGNSDYYSKNVIQYANGDGNDIITGFKANDTIQITSGTYTTTRSGNDIIVNVGSGSITVKDAPVNLNVKGTYGSSSSSSGSYSSSGSIESAYDGQYIKGTSGADTIFASHNNVTVEGVGGADFLAAFINSGMVIKGDAGNDIVGAAGGKYNSLYGGDGDDIALLMNDPTKIYVDGGTGDDVLYVDSGVQVTLHGGNGDDKFYFSPDADVADGFGSVVSAVISDLSSDDWIVVDSENRTLTKSTVRNGNVVLMDDSGTFQVTLAGVSDINQVGDVMYMDYKANKLTTLGDKFGGTSSGVQYVVNSNNNTEVNYTNVTNVINNITYTTVIGGDYVAGDKNIYIDQSSNTSITIVGITVNQDNSVHINNSYTEQNFSLSNYTQYNNVVNIDGSGVSGAKYLAGNSNSNSIKAGSGGSTLYGGGQGNNTLVGGAGRDFFQYSGGGYDTATNFTAGSNANSDVLYFSSSVSSIRRESSSMYFNSADGTRM